MKLRTSEKAEQAHVVQLLRAIGGKVWVTGTRRPRGDHPGTCMTPGIPDVIAFLPPRPCAHPDCGSDHPLVLKSTLLFVECKAAGGRLRPEQREFQGLCDDAGVSHVVGGLDAVIAFLVARHYVKAEQFPTYRHPKEIRP